MKRFSGAFAVGSVFWLGVAFGCAASPIAPSDEQIEKFDIGEPIPCTTDTDCARKNPQFCGGPYEPACPVPNLHGQPMFVHGLAVGLPDGRAGWVCATQLRTYLSCDRNDAPSRCESHREHDHYVSLSPCPVRPID